MKIEISHIKWILAVLTLSVWSCKTGSNSIEKLEVVTYCKFNEFVKETGYITDGE